MKRFWLISVLTLTAAIPARAQSIGGSPIQFGVMGGLTKPVGDLSGATNNDWNLGGLLLLGDPESKLRFRLDAQQQQLAGKVSGGSQLMCIGCTGTSYSRDYRVLDATANAVLSGALSRSTRIYLVGGLGVYNARGTNIVVQDALVVHQSSSVTRFGVNSGVGVNFKMGRHAGFVEARYHNVFGNNSFERDGINGDAPGSFQFVPVNVGFIF